MKYLDEKDGVFKDAHDHSFTWNAKKFEVEMDENVGRVFRLQFASGDYTPGRVLIKVIQFPSHLKSLLLV